MPNPETPARASNRLVAVVDDEAALVETVTFALRREGFRTESHPDGQAAWEMFSQALPDLVVLDILMPRMDGLELCRRLRTRSQTLPILFLTSKDEEFDRVLGLELGADDYLCKPFSVRELVARVKVLLRRAALPPTAGTGEEEALLSIGPLCLDLRRYQARWREQELRLTVTEFRMLHALVRHPGHVKTRDQLLHEAYPHDTYLADRTIDSHVKRLRRKFEDADSAFDGIDTAYGLGYRWRDG
ncbi:MAG: response regulator transcription factor [Acidobacteriota bacterium]